MSPETESHAKTTRKMTKHKTWCTVQLKQTHSKKIVHLTAIFVTHTCNNFSHLCSMKCSDGLCW